MSNIQKRMDKSSMTPPQSELLVDLSEQDQEMVSAGFGLTYLYFEQEYINASASNTTEIDDLSPGSGSGRTSQQSNYDSRRTTFAFGGLIPISSVSSFISSIIKLF